MGDSMEIIIEKGTENDISELEALYDDMNDYLARTINYPGWKKGIYPVRKDAEAGINEETLFVARNQDRIVGTIILSHETEQGYDKADWNINAADSEAFVIHTLVVHPDYLKNHIGRMLLEFAEGEGRRNHMKALRLDVYEENIPAIKLYEACGYEYIGMADLGYGSYGLDWFKLYEKSLA
jgi:ribosomal protein S18 acetylase RimI-like enzyme